MVLKFKDKGFEKEIKKSLGIDIITKDALSGVIGLGIHTGELGSAVPVPWESTSTAFSMLLPNLYFDVEKSSGGWESDLAHFNMIKSLYINVPTTDLGALTNFTNLRELYIKDSTEKTWSFIPTLISLKSLFLRKCSFTDLTVLRELIMKQKELLESERNNAKSSWLSTPVLENLGLVYCGISDISPLEGSLIDELCLSHNEITDISPLRGIPSLYYLTLRYNKIEDITPLSDLDEIYFINLRHNNITNVDPLRDHYVSRLFLGGNPIKDYSPLRKLRLIYHDMNLDQRHAVDVLVHQLQGKYIPPKPVQAEDIIGTWAKSPLFLTGDEDTVIAFEENGTGVLFDIVQPDFTLVNTFNWSMEEGLISIKGVKRFTLKEGNLTEVIPSELEAIKVKVEKLNRKALDGSRIMAIEFEESVDATCEGSFGFISKDIWEIKHFATVKELLSKGDGMHEPD